MTKARSPAPSLEPRLAQGGDALDLAPVPDEQRDDGGEVAAGAVVAGGQAAALPSSAPLTNAGFTSPRERRRS